MMKKYEKAWDIFGGYYICLNCDAAWKVNKRFFNVKKCDVRSVLDFCVNCS